MAARLIYLHGLNSAPQSTKAQQLKQRVDALPEAVRPSLLIPALPHRPCAAMALVGHLIDTVGPKDLTLIGSSLGGYYATWLAEHYAADRVRAVVINPTTGPARDLRPYMGRQRNLYSGDEYDLTEDHLREFLALTVDRLTDPGRYYLMLQTWLGQRLLVDKTPAYAVDPEALARAEAYFEDPIYIHLLRHPYGMVRSFEEAKLDQLWFPRLVGTDADRHHKSA